MTTTTTSPTTSPTASSLDNDELTAFEQGYVEFTESQDRLQTIIVGCTTSLSIIGSLIILKLSRHRLGEAYQRFMFFLSCGDVVMSSSFFVQFFLSHYYYTITRQENGGDESGEGAERIIDTSKMGIECSILGFTTVSGSMIVSLYSAALSIYFFLAITRSTKRRSRTMATTLYDGIAVSSFLSSRPSFSHRIFGSNEREQNRNYGNARRSSYAFSFPDSKIGISCGEILVHFLCLGLPLCVAILAAWTKSYGFQPKTRLCVVYDLCPTATDPSISNTTSSISTYDNFTAAVVGPLSSNMTANDGEECINGFLGVDEPITRHSTKYVALHVLVLMFCPLIGAVATISIYVHVRKTLRKSQQYEFRATHGSGSTSISGSGGMMTKDGTSYPTGDGSGDMFAATGGGNSNRTGASSGASTAISAEVGENLQHTQQQNRQQRRTSKSIIGTSFTTAAAAIRRSTRISGGRPAQVQTVFIQCMAYTIIYINSFVWFFILIAYHARYHTGTPFLIRIIGMSFFSSQGTFNAMIYLRPKIAKMRAQLAQQHDDGGDGNYFYSWWRLLYLVAILNEEAAHSTSFGRANSNAGASVGSSRPRQPIGSYGRREDSQDSSIISSSFRFLQSHNNRDDGNGNFIVRGGSSAFSFGSNHRRSSGATGSAVLPPDDFDTSSRREAGRTRGSFSSWMSTSHHHQQRQPEQQHEQELASSASFNVDLVEEEEEEEEEEGKEESEGRKEQQHGNEGVVFYGRHKNEEREQTFHSSSNSTNTPDIELGPL